MLCLYTLYTYKCDTDSDCVYCNTHWLVFWINYFVWFFVIFRFSSDSLGFLLFNGIEILSCRLSPVKHAALQLTFKACIIDIPVGEIMNGHQFCIIFSFLYRHGIIIHLFFIFSPKKEIQFTKLQIDLNFCAPSTDSVQIVCQLKTVQAVLRSTITLHIHEMWWKEKAAKKRIKKIVTKAFSFLCRAPTNAALTMFFMLFSSNEKKKLEHYHSERIKRAEQKFINMHIMQFNYMLKPKKEKKI